jgi:hypothetical protein
VTRLALFDFVRFFGGFVVVFVLVFRNRGRCGLGGTISRWSRASSLVAIVGTLGRDRKLVLDDGTYEDFVVVRTTDDTTLVELFHEVTDLVGVQILLSFPVVSQVSVRRRLVGGRLVECDCMGGGGLEDRVWVACVFLDCESVQSNK